MSAERLGVTETIIIWTEGGREIGMGHICRCLVIARQIRRAGLKVEFLINDEQSVVDMIKAEKFDFRIAGLSGIDPLEPEQGTRIVIDTKKQVGRIVNQLKQSGYKTVLIDNVTTARLEADVVIYPSALFDEGLDWHGFHGDIYFGADYVPISEGFLRARKNSANTESQLPQKILVTMGGSDPNQLTHRIVASLLGLSYSLDIKVVLGPAFSGDTRLKNIEKKENHEVAFLENIKDLSNLMAGADIAITSVGTTIYELACIGLPFIIIANHVNDERDLNVIREQDFALPLGYHKDVTVEDIQGAVSRIINDRELRNKLYEKGTALIDGNGAERIVNILQNIN